MAYGMAEPARHSLYARVPRNVRYKGQNAVDTAVWRFGDTVIALSMNALRVLGVTTQGYYRWRNRPPSKRARDDAELSVEIEKIFKQHDGDYGAPRVHAELIACGWICGRKRVARLMQAEGLVGRAPRRRICTTMAGPTRPPAANLVARDFTATEPERLCVGDITFIPTWEGWLYLAFLLDVASRRVVGWAMADHLYAELSVAASQMALRNRRPAPGLIHHTDRGSQYTANAYHAVLASQQIIPSMSRAGDCYDNAVAESFLATLKTELIHRQPWPTRTAARQAIFEWIEVFYNRQRRHSALDYLSPMAFEHRLTQKTGQEVAFT
jgi:transposase InsO family protein